MVLGGLVTGSDSNERMSGLTRIAEKCRRHFSCALKLCLQGSRTSRLLRLLPYARPMEDYCWKTICWYFCNAYSSPSRSSLISQRDFVSNISKQHCMPDTLLWTKCMPKPRADLRLTGHGNRYGCNRALREDLQAAVQAAAGPTAGGRPTRLWGTN
jgi:hypothetical protein